MRVLFVTNHLVMGGVEMNIVRLARELTARGHEVVVAAGPGALVPELEAAGGRLVPLAMRRSVTAMRSDVQAVADVLARDRPDIVHVFSASAGVVTAAARRWNRLRQRPAPPVVASIMGLHNYPGEPGPRVAVRAMMTATGARRLIVIAPAIAAVVRRLPIRAHRIVEQPVVGVELLEPAGRGHAAKVRADLGVPQEAQIVTTIGRLDPRKSHELFIRAAADVRQQHPRAVFLLVGDGTLEADLREEARRCGVTDVMHFLGARHDVAQLLQATDVCVRPGIVEGFIGITVLEAQACGVPVVSFETEDVKLAISDGETGYLVPRGDVARLARTISGLLADPELARRIGAAGRRHVEQNYAMPTVAEGLERLYITVSAEAKVS